ncbi:MAG: hypothetical protein ACFFCI_11200, partial [Promethearchaeota archaeon]
KKRDFDIMSFQLALLYMNILDLIISAISISAYLLLVISSFKLQGNHDRVKKSNIFAIIGILEIFSIFMMKNLNQFFQSLPYLPLNLSHLFAVLFIIIIPAVISLNTFGILFIILGRMNTENQGKKLVIAGILWMIFQGIYIVLFMSILPPLIAPLLIGARVLFILYAFKMGERYLKITAILLLIATLLYLNYLLLDPPRILSLFYLLP